MIKEAAVHYQVSRAKLHRLVRQGQLTTTKDPRDERVTLLRTSELEGLFRFPGEEGEEMGYKAETPVETAPPGIITAEWCARIDAIRERIGPVSGNSADMIREEREKRSRQVYLAAFGEELDEEEA